MLGLLLKLAIPELRLRLPPGLNTSQSFAGLLIPSKLVPDFDNE